MIKLLCIQDCVFCLCYATRGLDGASPVSGAFGLLGIICKHISWILKVRTIAASEEMQAIAVFSFVSSGVQWGHYIPVRIQIQLCRLLCWCPSPCPVCAEQSVISGALAFLWVRAPVWGLLQAHVTMERLSLEETSNPTQPLLWAGLSPTSSGCPGPHPTWPWVPPGMGHHSFSGQLCQHLTALWVKDFLLTSNLNLPT